MGARNIHYVYLISIVFVILSGCEKLSNVLCEKKELLRVTSPDKKVEAVLVRTDCGGATTNYGYRLSIVPLGKKPAWSDTVFLAEKLEGERIRWIAPKVLEIRYKKARISNFRNFWYSKDVDNYAYVVEVYEKSIGKQGDVVWKKGDDLK